MLLAAAVGLCLYVTPPVLPAYIAVIIAASLLLFYVVVRVLHGSADPLLLGWVLLFPLGYYFFSFPREKPVFNLDRVTVLMLLAAMCFAPAEKPFRAPRQMRNAALAWSAFVIAAAFSLIHVTSVLSSLRILADAFVLPALLGWYVIRSFDVRRHLRTLHALVCFMAIYLAAIGLVEMFLGKDLLPLPGGGVFFAGQGATLVFRPSGPFTSNNSYGLIGLITFCLLLFLGRVMSQELHRWQRWLHFLGAISAVVVALLPLFRSIVLTLSLIFLIEIYRSHRFSRRLTLIVLSLTLGGLLLLAGITVPEVLEERSADPSNIYARIADQWQAWELFERHPFTGVGLGEFHAAVQRHPAFAKSVEGVAGLDYPHSNLADILAEVGLLGFLPYVLSQVLLVKAFWKPRGSDEIGSRLAWVFFLYVFLSYWVSGLALTSGVFSDLNLWFVFTFAVLYKFSMRTRSPDPAGN